MSKIVSCLFTILLLTAQGLTPALANDALQRIPEHALGFVVIHNVAQASAKFDQLLDPFAVTFPSPITFAKLVTGLDSGLDVAGDVVIAQLPGDGPKGTTKPIVFLPIANYKEFAASIHADKSGEICRITMLGEDILVAQDGSYAMLMNVEDRETMEQLVALEPEPITALSSVASWLPNQDVALVLMPNGVDFLSTWERQPTSRFGIGYDFTQSRSMFSQFLTEMSGPEVRSWLRSNVDVAALGVTVDDQSNVRIGQQLILKENSPLAKFAPETVLRKTEKLGLSDQPYVFTAGGPVAPGWGTQLAGFFRRTEQTHAAEYGLENIPSELWEQEEKAYQQLLGDIRSCSIVMLAGEKGEPLVGNFLGVATVPDVSEYLESLPQIIKTWNELVKLSTNDIQTEFELTPRDIAGKQGYEILADVASTARDPNVPATNWMLESAFGPAGKLRLQVTTVDSTTLAFGLATELQITALLSKMQQGQTAMPGSAEAQATLQLLPPDAPWKLLIRPQGCLHWTSRVVNEFLAPLGFHEMAIPDAPDSPPVGLTVDWNNRRLECELFCPKQTWETIGKYVENFSSR